MEQRHYWLHVIDGIDEEWMLFLSKAENSPSTGTLQKPTKNFRKIGMNGSLKLWDMAHT